VCAHVYVYLICICNGLQRICKVFNLSQKLVLFSSNLQISGTIRCLNLLACVLTKYEFHVFSSCYIVQVGIVFITYLNCVAGYKTYPYKNDNAHQLL
jgi:hypothetical protein